MKKNYTYDELVNLMKKKGCNLAEYAIADMMDMIEEETGTWPNWDEEAPEWVVKNCLG